MMTCKGADQIMLMYVAKSMKRWASTDMRLTISPTVEDFLAELVITRACGIQKKGRIKPPGEGKELYTVPRPWTRLWTVVTADLSPPHPEHFLNQGLVHFSVQACHPRVEPCGFLISRSVVG